MNMKTVSATEIQNNFGKYLKTVQSGEDVVIMKNGVEVARLISSEKTISFLSDSLVGVLKHDYSDEEVRSARTLKYENND